MPDCNSPANWAMKRREVSSSGGWPTERCTASQALCSLLKDIIVHRHQYPAEWFQQVQRSLNQGFEANSNDSVISLVKCRTNAPSICFWTIDQKVYVLYNLYMSHGNKLHDHKWYLFCVYAHTFWLREPAPRIFKFRSFSFTVLWIYGGKKLYLYITYLALLH